MPRPSKPARLFLVCAFAVCGVQPTRLRDQRSTPFGRAVTEALSIFEVFLDTPSPLKPAFKFNENTVDYLH